jgi:NAD(P)-dependent dehydrogenase (short-subunit alcohol dehydrogenase family)
VNTEQRVAVVTGAGRGIGMEESRWVTGQTLIVDGGLSTRL